VPNLSHTPLRNVLYCDGHVKSLNIYAPGVTWGAAGTPNTLASNPCSPWKFTGCQDTGAQGAGFAITSATVETQTLWSPTYGS
jgi:prepilin-type processing-associated H-X9-DG protein